ncbi:family 43 glycosylhydrolase [Lentzea sp. NPDC058450]|uniref:family 43 glycosylhydrolase n=1 Tax=Lentzea sp. NPDC058450 TaxID=3346505 RepID=UPI00365FD996
MKLVNKDSAGNAAIRFDVNGNAIDAHDGQIQRFGDTYYLYGTSYGCGFEWNTPGARFCGFVSYSSPDLVNWTPRGPLFDATGQTWQTRCDGRTYGCFRPHVVYNEVTRKYVLWINTYDNGVGYRVLTSPNPTSGFREVAAPDLGPAEGPPGGVNYGDHQVFVDDDGAAYLAFTDWRRAGDLIVEKLDRTYTTGSGQWRRVGIRSTEAPTIFKRDGRYYLTYSDPNRGYTTTGTGFVTASSPLGPWTGTGVRPDAWSVSGGALRIGGGEVGLSKDGESWRDYTFTALATPEQSTEGEYAQVGLVVRSSNSGDYRWLIGNYPHAGATGGNLTKLIPGKGAVTVGLPMAITTGQRYEIRIEVAGAAIRTFIDGVLVDTTTDTASATGRVGFRQHTVERATVDSVTVTAPDGKVLLSDDFSGDLSRWDTPGPILTGTNITTTSCGGQPTDVLKLDTKAGPLYLYQSDVWMNAKPNEALAKHYWQPLEFDASGAIKPIECGVSYDVRVPARKAETPRPAAVSTGHTGYRTHWDISGGLQRAQTFTVPKNGRLSEVRFTSFQTGYPDAGLTLELKRFRDGVPGETVASSVIARDQVSWAAAWVPLRLASPLKVRAGEQFALVVRTTSGKGSYGIAYTDTSPHSGGSALISNDSGASWRTEAGRSLHLEADVR